jgi:hypothetical protein
VAGSRVALALLLVITGLGTLPSCAVTELEYRNDHRLELLTPTDLVTVRTPFLIRWRVHNFVLSAAPTDCQSGAGHVAIFIDRAPIAPGDTLEGMTNAELGGVVADPPADGYRVQQLGPLLNAPKGEENLHEVTIALLDCHGRRVGESSAYVQFRVTSGSA